MTEFEDEDDLELDDAIESHPLEDEDDDGEIDVQVVKDPIRDKKSWTKDPLDNRDDPNDADLGPRVKKRIGKLTASLTEAARQRDAVTASHKELIQYTRSLQDQLNNLEGQFAAGQITAVEARAEAAKAKGEFAQAQLQDALVKGDTAVIAKANRDLADASAASVDAEKSREAAKVAAEAAAKKRTQVVQNPEQRQVQADPPLRTKWFSENPWFELGPGGPANRKSGLALAISQEVIREGYVGDTKEYFEEVDKRLKKEFGEGDKQRRPVVPPSRSSGAAVSQQANGQKRTTITFTQSQLAQAKRLGIPIEGERGKKALAKYFKEIQKVAK